MYDIEERFRRHRIPTGLGRMLLGPLPVVPQIVHGADNAAFLELLDNRIHLLENPTPTKTTYGEETLRQVSAYLTVFALISHRLAPLRHSRQTARVYKNCGSATPNFLSLIVRKELKGSVLMYE